LGISQNPQEILAAAHRHVMGAFAGLVAATSGSAIAPFIYVLF
jgi:hypothetical protein